MRGRATGNILGNTYRIYCEDSRLLSTYNVQHSTRTLYTACTQNSTSARTVKTTYARVWHRNALVVAVAAFVTIAPGEKGYEPDAMMETVRLPTTTDHETSFRRAAGHRVDSVPGHWYPQ
ncbi:Hypothetical protein CINCED_3A002362 [Cinara cedri]|uniref:Uncharacterized protein n=1 Tax=Cinara cedri TaxID=506608 RepID=A0A5E4N8J8_9HEMI|nr:Hypothetical protein CINCED_3A002362 [Cinara cedri]